MVLVGNMSNREAIEFRLATEADLLELRSLYAETVDELGVDSPRRRQGREGGELVAAMPWLHGSFLSLVPFAGAGEVARNRASPWRH